MLLNFLSLFYQTFSILVASIFRVLLASRPHGASESHDSFEERIELANLHDRFRGLFALVHLGGIAGAAHDNLDFVPSTRNAVVAS